MGRRDKRTSKRVHGSEEMTKPSEWFENLLGKFFEWLTPIDLNDLEIDDDSEFYL